MKPIELYSPKPTKVCPECGQYMEEQVESFMYECERCLANKEE
jgi:tRNA(Ile2) C34 agmatinyltransferase TiaS